MENNAGSVQPLLLVKNRKNSLETSQARTVQAIDEQHARNKFLVFIVRVFTLPLCYI